MPMIRTTLGAIVTAKPALDKVMTERMPIKMAYALAKLAKVLEPECAMWIQLRDSLLRELGTPHHGNVGSFVFTPEKGATFLEKENELKALPVEIDAAPFSLDAIGITAISAADVLALAPLLTDEAHAPQPTATT